MHICFITNEYPKTGFPHGGVGTFVQTLGRKLVEEGHHVSVIGINYDSSYQEENDNGVRIYRLERASFKGINWIFHASKINLKVKEIHAHNPLNIIETAELGLAFLKKIPAIKYVIRLHGGHHFFAEAENRGINKWKGFLEKRSFSKADGFIAVSKYVKSHTEKYLSYNNKPIETINYPISFSKFYVSDKSNQAPFSIVFAGTVCEKKGVRQLIQALPLILEKFPETQLHIYGRDWFFTDKTSYIEFLKRQTPKDLLEKITYHGAISHDLLSEAYEKGAVCVFPSHMETQGLVAPEAMAMEKVVVFTKLGPGPETIEHLKTGLLCNPLDPKDIASKIIWVFDNSDKSCEIGFEARKFVLNKFDIEKVYKSNNEFYNKLNNN